MPDTVKKEMSLNIEGGYDAHIVIVALDDNANEWLDHQIGDDTPRSLERKAAKRWYLGPYTNLTDLLRRFMREGGVIG